MPPSKQVAGPGLGIVINNNLGRPYQPGDIITGRVVREAHVVSPMAVVEVWLLGRAKVKLGVKNRRSDGSSTTTYYRGRFNFFDKIPQRIQAGPVHVPPNGPPESWPFAIEIPSTMSPKSVLSEYKDHKDFSSGSFVPLDAQTIQEQSLPSSFTAMGYNVGTEFECYVEYHVEASLVLQGRHGKVISASQPIGVRAKPMSYPPASFEFLQRRLYVSEVNTFRLVPGMQEAHLSFKQKTQKLFHSSKVPSLGLNIYMDTPTNIQLGNPLPVPLRIQIVPDRKRTSEVLHDAPQTALITSMELTLKAKTFVLANGYKKTYDTNGTAKHRISLPCLTTTSALLVDDAKGNDGSPPTYQEKGSAGPPHLDTKQRLPTPPRYERAAIEDTEGKLGAPTSSTAELRISPGESSASWSQSNPVVIPGPVSKRSGLRLPINWGPNAFNSILDIGTLMELRFFPDRIQILGNRCAETACRQAPGGVFPDFTTFCIKHEHALKWKVWLEIAGEVVALEGENPVSVQGPAVS